MSYTIDLGSWQSVFAVPAELVDKHLRLANAAHIKVILYLLRNSGMQFDAHDVAQAVGISESDVADALVYWQSCGLLARHDNGFAPPEYNETSEEVPIVNDTPQPVSRQPEPAASVPVIAPGSSPEPSKKSPKRIERVRYSYSECAEYLNSSEELRGMLLILEGMMQKQLNHTEISVFVTLVRWYGLPEACVALLVEYCYSIGKKNLDYIESTGVGWAGEEINTVELATEKIDRLRGSARAWKVVRTALDIPERKPTKKEEEYCGRWINDYGCGTELIQLAYERCIDSKGKLSMSYMNAIIDNWRKKGITTVEQALAENAPEKKPVADKGRYEPTYDKSEIEAVMFDEWFSDDGADGEHS